jgi:hypothetical protein
VRPRFLLPQQSPELHGLAINTGGTLIETYLPCDKKTGLRAAGIPLRMKYNSLSPSMAT